MILTGKCREDFEYKFNMSNFNELDDTLKNARYIEFFDSKEIFIHHKRNCTGIKFNHWYYIITNKQGVHLNNFLRYSNENDSRQEAIKDSITEANEIYNHLNKD